MRSDDPSKVSKAKRQRILNEKGEEIAEMGVQIPGIWMAVHYSDQVNKQ